MEPSERRGEVKDVIGGPDYIESHRSELGLLLLLSVAESHWTPLSRGVACSDLNTLIRSLRLLWSQKPKEGKDGI